jgi:hypothetical protein
MAEDRGQDVGRLTMVEAYDAMRVFLEAYWRRGGGSSSDLAVLLGCTQRAHDHRTIDPAQWFDWIEAVASVRESRPFIEDASKRGSAGA